MFSSLRFRLWLTYALVVAVVISIAGLSLLAYLLRNPAVDRREVQRLRVFANLLLQRNQLWGRLDVRLSQEELDGVAERADANILARVVVYDANGEVLVDSRAKSATELPSLALLQQRNLNEVPFFRDAKLRQWVYVLTPMPRGGYLLLASPRSRPSALTVLRDEFLTPFARGALLALVLALLLAFGIANWITRPLQRIADAARSVPGGMVEPLALEGPAEVRSLAQAFNEMSAQVEASQRSQRDFIANVSHDLKTPLTSIQGFAQAILDGTADDAARRRQAAEVIFEEAGRMYRLVQDLLELARLDAKMAHLEYVSLDLGQLLQGIVEKFTPLARQAQVELQFASSESLWLPGDADRLAQVFTNLMDNAVKYTPAGGQVTIMGELAGEWVEVRVADTGPGIPPEEAERIFERFYQMDKSRRRQGRSSVGLGLAIAREIVLAHGGSITVQGREDLPNGANGSMFVVRLPRVGPEDARQSRRR